VFPFGHAAMWNLLKEWGVKVTIHGFRSSFRDWAGEQGHNTDAAEAALSHVLGAATRRSYQRGTLLAPREGLMASWAEFCANCGIIPLKKKAA
jgi:integrase